MSNPISNIIALHTDKATFKKIAAIIVNKDRTNFNSILPAPEGLKGDDLADWRRENWGCYAEGIYCCANAKRQEIEFETNHRGATLISAALSRMFPDVKVEFWCEEPRWDEEGDEHWYSVTDFYLNGELLSHEQERIDEDWDEDEED